MRTIEFHLSPLRPKPKARDRQWWSARYQRLDHMEAAGVFWCIWGRLVRVLGEGRLFLVGCVCVTFDIQIYTSYEGVDVF